MAVDQSPISQDVISLLQAKLARLERAVETQRHQLQSLNVFDLTTPPLDAIDGQIAIDQSSGQPFYYWNLAWHPFNGPSTKPCIRRSNTSLGGVVYTPNTSEFVIPYDYAWFDTHNFKAGINDYITIPAGLGGMYYISALVHMTTVPYAVQLRDARISIWREAVGPDILLCEHSVHSLVKRATYTMQPGIFERQCDTICELRDGEKIYATIYCNYITASPTICRDGDHVWLDAVRLGDAPLVTTREPWT